MSEKKNPSRKTFQEMSSEEYQEYMDRIKELQMTALLIFMLIGGSLAFGATIFVLIWRFFW